VFLVLFACFLLLLGFEFCLVFCWDGQLDCVQVHYQHFCGYRQVDSPGGQVQFISYLTLVCNMQLNMLNDLAKAMKALDGKKSSVAGQHRHGWWGGPGV